MATWKQIETSREIRLWISQIIVPVIGVTGALMAIPEVREAVKVKAVEIKEKIKSKLNKEEVP